MAVLSYILLAAAVGAMLFFFVGIWATVRHVRLPAPRLPEGQALPPVSLLKPIKGSEESLEDNLRSFFEQDYAGPLEIVFAATEPDDPGIAVARRLAREYPEVETRFVTSDADFGLNPKVANLAGALRVARHDIVLQSDANVRARPDYLTRLLTEYVAEDASLLTSMVVGVGERSVGAAMENLQLSAFISPAMCTALHVAGVSCVVGKSMLLRRSELREIGGLEIVRDILAEDFILGERYQKAGKKVLLSATTVENVNEAIGVSSFLGRHSRWLKMRAVIHVGGFVADLGANPITLGLLAFVASGFEGWVGLVLAGLTLTKLASDAYLVSVVRGSPMKPTLLALAPVKDLLMGAVWVYACFSRSVCWRGRRLRLGAGSRLRPDDGALPVRVARRVLGLSRPG